MPRPLGRYIQHEFHQKSKELGRILRRQTQLRRQGEEQQLGQFLLGAGVLTTADLERCLMLQRRDMLRDLDLFESLPRTSLERIAMATTTEVVPQGRTIFLQGDSGDSYYLIISGRVRIVRHSECGSETVIAVLGAGEGFGEMALLSGEPRSATVQTDDRTSLLRISRDLFDILIAENPRLARAFARVLSERLQRGNVQLRDASAMAEAYRGFITDTTGPRMASFIGSGPASVELQEKIASAGRSDRPVLVYGEPGCELWDIGALVHHGSRRRDNILLSMDAQGAGSPGTHTAVEPSDLSMVELAQWSALFGRVKHAQPLHPEPRLGIAEMARDGTVIIEHIESLTPAMQEQLADLIEKGRFRPYGDCQDHPSTSRIIVTTHAQLDDLAAHGAFSHRLLKLLAPTVLTVPPLRFRKKDLGMIAANLIAVKARSLGKAATGLTEEAGRALLAHDWPGNRDELASVIVRAVNISKGPLLSPEDLFIGPPPSSGRFSFNLLSLKKVQELFTAPAMIRVMKLSVAVLITVIIAAGLFGHRSADANVAVVLMWGMWEPLLVLGTLFAARGWCAVCPIGTLNEAVSSAAGFRRKVPQFLARHSPYIAGAGIALIYWAEHQAGMLHDPRSTAMLVITVISLAIVTGLVFARRSWCRYFCPLGALCGSLATSSAIELRSDFNQCTIECRDQPCRTITNKRGGGCPVFEAPFMLRSNQHCIMCGECVRTCGKGSPRLNIRIPGAELWNAKTPDRAVAVLAIFLLGSQIFRAAAMGGLLSDAEYRAMPWPVSLAFMAGGIMLAYVITAIIARAVVPREGNDGLAGLRAAYILLPTITAVEIAYHLERLLLIGGTFGSVAARQAGLTMQIPGLVASSSTVHFYQGVLLAAGMIGSMLLARKYARDSGRYGFRLLRDGWVLLSTGMLFLAAFLFL